uniref:Uncharacterized protein n=1 Tax=Arundo donax TaxID=35708 RepID=A0A0A9DV21_ARUDO
MLCPFAVGCAISVACLSKAIKHRYVSSVPYPVSDTYPIRIRDRYVTDTYRRSIGKKTNKRISDTWVDTYWPIYSDTAHSLGPLTGEPRTSRAASQPSRKLLSPPYCPCPNHATWRSRPVALQLRHQSSAEAETEAVTAFGGGPLLASKADGVDTGGEGRSRRGIRGGEGRGGQRLAERKKAAAAAPREEEGCGGGSRRGREEREGDPGRGREGRAEARGEEEGGGGSSRRGRRLWRRLPKGKGGAGGGSGEGKGGASGGSWRGRRQWRRLPKMKKAAAATRGEEEAGGGGGLLFAGEGRVWLDLIWVDGPDGPANGSSIAHLIFYSFFVFFSFHVSY